MGCELQDELSLTHVFLPHDPQADELLPPLMAKCDTARLHARLAAAEVTFRKGAMDALLHFPSFDRRMSSMLQGEVFCRGSSTMLLRMAHASPACAGPMPLVLTHL